MSEDFATLPIDRGQGDVEMADYQPAQQLANNLHEQNMAALGQLGNVLQKDAINVSKVIDYDYMEGKRLVDLTEAMGAREVASEKNPGGPSKPD